MFSKFIIKLCHSMNLNSASFEFHWCGMNSKSKLFYFLFDFAKNISLHHDINIKRRSWFRIYGKC